MALLAEHIHKGMRIQTIRLIDGRIYIAEGIIPNSKSAKIPGIQRRILTRQTQILR